MAHCPSCKSDRLRRSRTRSRWERWRKEITGRRPYRCLSCNWRGWLPIGIGDALEARTQRSQAPDPPNLRGTLLARRNPRHRFEVKQLDAFDANAGKDDA